MRVTVLEESQVTIGTYDVDNDRVTVRPNFVPADIGATFVEDPDNLGSYIFTWTPQNMDNVTLE